MPVIPEYRPTQAPGSNARDFLGAYAGMSSLMERKQRLAMAQEDQAMEREKFEAFKPVMYAKAKADLTTAAAAIANAARMEDLRAKAAAKSAEYNDRFLNIMYDPESTQEQRYQSLAYLQGEISWLDNEGLPEYKGFVDAVDNTLAKTFTKTLTNQKLEQALEVNQNTVGGRVAVAETNAAAKQANAQTYSQSRERIAAINADTKLTVEDKRAQRSAIQLKALQQQALDNDQMAADAQAEGNIQLAATYRQQAANTRDAIEKTTTFAGTGSSAPRTAAQDPRPTPKQETTLPPLTLGGKSLASKLYAIDENTKSPTFAPSVRTPTDIMSAVDQMVADKAITPDEGRAMLLRLGFRSKKK